jgi:predicted O-methyltransferase YrrM
MGKLWRYGEPLSEGSPSKTKVCIATPSYGDVSPGYLMSVVGACDQLRVAGIEYVVIMYSEHCHVDDSRNHIVKHFLETDCTDLVFVDADTQFNPADTLTVVGHDCDVVGGIVRLKQDNEEYAVKLLDESVLPDVLNNPFEVYALGTAFLRIRRHVLESLAKDAIKFPDKHMGGEIPIIFERTVEDGCRWGGDYSFCRKWRKLGGKIFADASIELWHSGTQHWRGIYSAWAKRISGVGMSHELSLISSGQENGRTVHEMCTIYSNERFAATPELVQALIMLARECKGNILECGSGLTTLVMAAANPVATVWAFEDDPVWQHAILTAARSYGLKNVNVIHSHMKDYGDFEWYALPENLPQFDMVLCDGPKSGTKGGRKGLYELLCNNVNHGAKIVCDDADLIDASISCWGGKIVTLGANRLFAITTKE